MRGRGLWFVLLRELCFDVWGGGGSGSWIEDLHVVEIENADCVAFVASIILIRISL